MSGRVDNVKEWEVQLAIRGPSMRILAEKEDVNYFACRHAPSNQVASAELRQSESAAFEEMILDSMMPG